MELYGVAYTPEPLAAFVAELLHREAGDRPLHTILDPACGRGALLHAARSVFWDACKYTGNDEDQNALSAPDNLFSTICEDALMPSGREREMRKCSGSIAPAFGATTAVCRRSCRST